MSELINVEVSKLKANETYSNLVPTMTVVEFQDFLGNVKKNGVQTPIHINKDMTILDGRHRVKACVELGIKEIDSLVHNFDESEALAFVTTTAVQKRNLTVAQRIDIVLRSKELIAEIENKANKNRINALNKGNSPSGPTGPNGKSSNEQLADIAGSSKNQVIRMKKIKREDPEKYNEVLKGEKSISGAYCELPTVVDKYNKPDSKGGIAKRDRTEYFKERKVKNEQHKAEMIEQLNEKYSNIDIEESQKTIAYENLMFNLNQLNMYVEQNKERLDDSIHQALQMSPEVINLAINNMKEIIKSFKERGNTYDN